MGQRIEHIKKRLLQMWQFGTVGVWSNRSTSWRVKIIRTINLSVRSFMNSGIQSQACAMTYRTVLAIVPIFAMLFALGRGFGLQKLIESEVYSIFRAQKEVINHMMVYVDSYLDQAGEGVFVGVGILFLLWTLISLVSSVEDVFNNIWGIKIGRSIWRKVTDYTAMLLILPVLLICSGGLSILMSSVVTSVFHFEFMTPLVSALLEFGSWLFTWLFFTAAYMLIPNVKVRFGNAFLAGVLAGTGYMVLQWIFVTGQMYVAKYNTIYGSVSFIPLMLIWLQLVWVVTLSGAVLCYASQNIYEFDFKDDVDGISLRYREKVLMAIATIAVHRFAASQKAPTVNDIVVNYSLPPRLVTDSLDALVKAGVLSQVIVDEKRELLGYQPATDIDVITVAWLRDRLEDSGRHGFIPRFDEMFPGVVSIYDNMLEEVRQASGTIRLADLKIEEKNRQIKDRR